MVLGLVVAALAEAVGIGAMLPLFAMVLRQQTGSDASQFGEESEVERQVADAFAGVESTRGELERLERAAQERSSRREQLEFELNELDKASPSPRPRRETRCRSDMR